MLNRDITDFITSVANDREVSPDVVQSALEESICETAKAQYGGSDLNILASIDISSGNITLAYRRDVVECVTDPRLEISIEEVKLKGLSLDIGDFFEESLPAPDLSRMAAQRTKKILFKRIKEASKLKQYEEFRDRVGDVIVATVENVEFGGAFVPLTVGEAYLPRGEAIPHEGLQPGDRKNFYIKEVVQNDNGHQVILSRTHSGLLRYLLAQEVFDIRSGVVEIVDIAREPGSRAKVSVRSTSDHVDPVGACIGFRGSHIHSISRELQGEKIEIVAWSSNIADYVVSALVPGIVTKVIVHANDENDEGNIKVDAIVPEDKISITIGSRGQNVRLARRITGVGITIMTEEEERERSQNEVNELSGFMMRALDVNEVMANFLVMDGMKTVEDIVNAGVDYFKNIDGFTDEIAVMLHDRAVEYIARRTELRKAFEWTDDQVSKLVEKEIYSLSDLRSKGRNDIAEITGVSLEAVDEIISSTVNIDER